MQILIAVPARFGSTRLPGKPLLEICGKTMLQRVYAIAMLAAKKYQNIECCVATDDERIVTYCNANNINCMLTPIDCRTGTDRLHAMLTKCQSQPQFVVNLQGDNPLCPPWIVQAIIDTYLANPGCEVVTACKRLSWQELAQLRSSKQATPFSGTTAIVDQNLQAIWFSKQVLPAIRNEAEHMLRDPQYSPVLRHIGLYGYRTDILAKIAALSAGYYEQYEGLEQLRFLENGIKIQVALVDYRGRMSMSGVDAPADIAKAEYIINHDGEF